MIATCCRAATQNLQLAISVGPDFRRFVPALWALPVWFSWEPLLPYFTAVLLLAVGLGIAIKKAPPHANWLDKIILCGPVFIAMPMAVFGTEHFLAPVAVGRSIPGWIPAHTFWVYFVGTCLILGALSIVFQKYAWLSAGLFGIMLLWFEVLMEIPRAVAAPQNRLLVVLAFRDFSFSWGALSFAATHTNEWRTKGTHWLITLARVLFGATILFFAVQYLLHPELLPGVPLRQLTPNFVPGHLLWGYLTSVVYALAGVCLLINKKVRLAATWTGLFVLFAVIVFCVPFMVQHGSNIAAGLNVPVDTLLLSGATLCLAGSQREKSSSPNKSTSTGLVDQLGQMDSRHA
jgi:uncharacterized membrane protein